MEALDRQLEISGRSEILSERGNKFSVLVVVLLTLTLALFVSKPLSVDDPLFVWTAKQIQKNPLNPYGFDVNWYGNVAPMWKVTENPPLASFLLAFYALIGGWSQVALHMAYLIPTAVLLLGAYRLSSRFCRAPMAVIALTLASPAVLVSATTLMCDIPMFAFWVWAIEFWIAGIEDGSHWKLALSSLLVICAAFTKYFGACLVPLLASWPILKGIKARSWWVWIAASVVGIFCLQYAGFLRYGNNLFLEAGRYALSVRTSPEESGSGKMEAVFTTFAFMGGCLGSLIIYLPLLWDIRKVIAGIFFVGLITLNVCYSTFVPHEFTHTAHPVGLMIQFVFWTIGGFGVLALCCSEILRNKNADSLLLGLWIFGTFVFTAFFNWTINGRSILPMTLPAGILLVRRWEFLFLNRTWSSVFNWLLIPGALLGIGVATADVAFAKAVQQAAQKVAAKYARPKQTLWFEGHWGFQYYMENYGAEAIDTKNPHFNVGDYIAVPLHNTNPLGTSQMKAVRPLETIKIPINGFLTTVNQFARAGFYSSEFGSLPFVFGKADPEEVVVYTMEKSALTNGIAGMQDKTSERQELWQPSTRPAAH